jgi:inosine/xanthosine triphosphate pyrophosphatase family protein
MVIASSNKSKVEYYKSVLTSISEEVLGLSEFGVKEKPTETGETAEENASIKAKFYAKKLDFPVFCEDEALYVDFLPEDKQPGVHVRRINGVDEVSD